MARICSLCHGKGKVSYPIYDKCLETDDGALNLMGKFIRIVGNKEVDCYSCNGKGIISYQPPPNLFFGD